MDGWCERVDLRFGQGQKETKSCWGIRRRRGRKMGRGVRSQSVFDIIRCPTDYLTVFIPITVVK